MPNEQKLIKRDVNRKLRQNNKPSKNTGDETLFGVGGNHATTLANKEPEPLRGRPMTRPIGSDNHIHKNSGYKGRFKKAGDGSAPLH